MNITDNDKTRFLAKVYTASEDGCWVWKAGKDKNGYGKFWIDGETRRAARVSYEMFVGVIETGKFVLHDCDNPPCCNPRHLKLGTAKDNAQECVRKGRHVWTIRPEKVPRGKNHHWHKNPAARWLKRGEENPISKLTDESVREIRILSAAGKGRNFLARRYGVSGPSIRSVVRGLTWRHVA